MKTRAIEIGTFLMLVLVGVAGRLMPHEPNFTPIAATALFAGFFFQRATLAAIVPLAAMLISDAVVGVYDYKVMAVVYLCMMAPVLLRPVLRRRLSVLTVGGTAAASSVSFFVLTNLAVWLSSGMYEQSLAGLARCYVAALPFFRNALLGDLLWSSALFGSYALVLALGRARQSRPALGDTVSPQ